jgi:lysophospholipid acyltransferase (LPLAT)-like uncharacterized protein
MKLGKRLLESEGVRAVLARLAAFYIRIVGATTHWEMRLAPSSVALRDSREPFLACFWHGRIMVIAAWNRHPRKLDVMISDHRDGRFIAQAIRYMGYGIVAGSSGRRGAAAMFGTQQILAGRGAMIMTPDGPRGPRMRAKDGAVKAAQLAGVPLIPVSCAVTRCRVLNSWDRFCVVLPLGYGVVLADEPMTVPGDADAEELARLTRELETRLNALSAEADRRCGRAVIEPAPAISEAERARA